MGEMNAVGRADILGKVNVPFGFGGGKCSTTRWEITPHHGNFSLENILFPPSFFHFIEV